MSLEKIALPVGLLSRAGRGIASMGRQVMRGGAQRMASGALRSRATNFAVSSGLRSGQTAGKALKHVGQRRATTRMLRRAAVGGVVGSGASALRDKAQGKEVSLGRSLASGFAGAALGGVAGTTLGKRGIRRFMSPRSTPDLTLRQSAKSLTSAKGVRAAVKNMAPMEKSMLAVSGYDTVKRMSSPTNANRGQSAGSAIGEGAGVLALSRWRGQRRGGRGGMLGAIARPLALLGATSVAGGAIGKRFDKNRVTKEAPYG